MILPLLGTAPRSLLLLGTRRDRHRLGAPLLRQAPRFLLGAPRRLGAPRFLVGAPRRLSSGVRLVRGGVRFGVPPRLRRAPGLLRRGRRERRDAVVLRLRDVVLEASRPHRAVALGPRPAAVRRLRLVV